MLYVGADEITALFSGEMGIKQLYAGDGLIYERADGCIYIELIASPIIATPGEKNLE